jgi:hypothetical protein
MIGRIILFVIIPVAGAFAMEHWSTQRRARRSAKLDRRERRGY